MKCIGCDKTQETSEGVMTEQEIFDELCKEFDIESPRLRKVSKAIHQKFLDSLEKTTSDLVDQHLEAEDKLKESHKQTLIDRLDRYMTIGVFDPLAMGNTIASELAQLKKERENPDGLDYLRKD